MRQYPQVGPVRAHRRLPVVRQPGGHHGRRGVVRQRPHRPGHEPAARTTSAACSTGSRSPTTWCSRSPRRRRRRPPTRSAAERGSVVALDVKTGAVLAMYSNPTFNPNGLSVHDTPGRAEHVQRHQQRRQACAAARVPRPLLSGLDVQGGHEQGGASKPASRRRATRSSPSRTASRSRDQHEAGQLRRRGLRRRPSRRASSTRATRRSRRSATSSATSSRRRWTSAASTAPPPIDLAPNAVESVGPRVGADQRPVRARPGSVRATCSPLRCRWRSSPRASPTAA